MIHFVEIHGADHKTAHLIRRCVRMTLRMAELPFRAKVNVTVTDDAQIQTLNREHRGIDRPTDVLSFPLLDWTDGDGDLPAPWDYDPETRSVDIGDVVLSYERAKAQAQEFGHSVERECGYLTVHSVLHLLGYDHVDDEPRRKTMRQREEMIMDLLGLKRGMTLAESAEEPEKTE